MKLLSRTCLLSMAILSWSPAPRAQIKPTGEPVPQDSAVFTSFKLLETQPAYRMTINMESSDPRMAKLAAQGMGMGPSETLVKGGVHQASMHMKLPAFDIKGAVDDWEIRAVVQNGRGARLITSPAVPRLQHLNEQYLAMEMAMLEKQAATAMARAAAQGPFGAIQAAMIGAETAAFSAMAAAEVKKANEFFGWKCMDELGSTQNADRKTNPLTDLRALGDQDLSGTTVAAYEFYVRDADRLQGPVKFFVNKSTGLPLRLDLTDPQSRGSIHMDYSYEKIADIEIPRCLAKAQ